jgi:3-oxoadipate enol-lactonase
MPFLETSPGYRLHYLEENPTGNPTILLLHGLGANCYSWQLQIPSLTQAGYQVMAPDARGFGKSPYPGGRQSIQLMAEDFAKLVNAKCGSPVDVVGISMGGVQALQLCLDHPEVVNKLILVNAFASLRPEKLSVWAFLVLRFIMVHTLGLPAQARFVTRRIFPKDEQAIFRDELYRQILEADPKGYRATMRSLALFKVNSRLHEINKSTLIITAEKDSVVPPKNQLILAEQIRGAKHVIIPDASHAVTVDQPVLFNQAMLDFLCSSS